MSCLVTASRILADTGLCWTTESDGEDSHSYLDPERAKRAKGDWRLRLGLLGLRDDGVCYALPGMATAEILEKIFVGVAATRAGPIPP